jgi:release factor glutamine methyltransferase
MRLHTVPGVFKPRSDSWLLAGRLRAVVRPSDEVLDPFAGTGLLAIAAAQRGARATAIDISRRAVACARLNARSNGVRIRALRGDMFKPVAGRQFDVIAANPPYVPSVNRRTPRGAARAWEGGPDGRRLLDRLCGEAPAHLRPGGTLLIVHSSVCAPELTAAMLAEAGMEVEVVDQRRGPLGPLLSARVRELEAGGKLARGSREEDVLVFRATKPGSCVSSASV